MPNNDTVVQALANGGKSFLPSASGGASSTAEFQIADASANPFILSIPGSSKLANRPIVIRAWGRTTEASTPNLTFKMYYGTSSTIGSNTPIFNSGALATTAASGQFYFTATLIWGSVSNVFNGVMGGFVNGTAMSNTTLTAVTKPGVSPTTEGLGLTATATFSGSNAANTVILDGWEMEVL